MVAIPEKFYVTRVYRSSEEVLGWMVVADKEHTKAFKETKAKADSWARKYNHTTRQYEDGMEPIYVDNTPRTGFRMVTNVSRYSTSNVVWRIMHPEGFEFEITSDNLCDLLETNTIIEGEFQDPLFFTHNKKLVNEKTKLFAELIKKEEKAKEQKEKTKDLAIGTLLVYNTYRSTQKFVYCGKVHAITVNSNKPYQLSAKSSLRLVLKDTSTGKYHLVGSISKDMTINEQFEDDEVNLEEIVQVINEQIKTTNGKINKYYHTDYVPNEVNPLFASIKPYKREQLKLVYETEKTANINYIGTDKVYLYGESMVFGFAWRGHYNWEETVDAEYYSGHNTMTHFRTYPIAGVDEKGSPVLDIDISEHRGIGRGCDSIFESIRNSYNKNNNKSLNTVAIPEEILVGRYVVGE